MNKAECMRDFFKVICKKCAKKILVGQKKGLLTEDYMKNIFCNRCIGAYNKLEEMLK